MAAHSIHINNVVDLRLRGSWRLVEGLAVAFNTPKFTSPQMCAEAHGFLLGVNGFSVLNYL